MKKIVALMLLCCLLCGCAAFAEGQITTAGGYILDVSALPYETEDASAPVVYYISSITPESLIAA